MNTADLLKPEKQNLYIYQLLRLCPSERAAKLLAIAPINVLLAAKCLREIRKPAEQLRIDILGYARQQAEVFTDPLQAQRALLALYELRAYDDMAAVFTEVTETSSFHRSLLTEVLREASTDFVFQLLERLFDNYFAKKSKQASDLCLWSIESLPDDLHITDKFKSLNQVLFERVLQEEPYYDGNAQKEINYNETLHLFYEKFPSLRQFYFDKLKLIGYERKFRKYHLRLAQRKSISVAFCLNVLETHNLLDLRAFTKLVHYAKDFTEAVFILNSVRSSDRLPNEITFTSLLNKASNYEQGREVLEQMRAADVLPDAFTFTSLLNKASNYEQGREVLK